ncbi:hypothetical protein TrVFT333_001008 [Trichoderma virens FT-333]|nr:hypothetical protein TrVFT333_001008 [Trichoderma virens FT-333]
MARAKTEMEREIERDREGDLSESRDNSVAALWAPVASSTGKYAYQYQRVMNGIQSTVRTVVGHALCRLLDFSGIDDPKATVQGLAYIYGAANSGNRRCDFSGPGVAALGREERTTAEDGLMAAKGSTKGDGERVKIIMGTF